MAVVFDFVDYKEYLASWLSKPGSRRGGQARLARAAGCGSSYLSQVLKGSMHLSIEQGLGAAKAMELSDREGDYLIELIQLARAGTPASRKYFRGRLRRIADAHFRDRTKPFSDVSAEMQRTVFSASWLHSAIRILAQLPGYRNVDAIAARLLVPRESVTAVLRELESAGLLERNPGGGWRSSLGPITLPFNSDPSRRFFGNWADVARGRAALPKTDETEASRFVLVSSLSAEDALKLKQAHTTFVDRTLAIKKQARNPDDLYCVVSSVFRV